MKWGELPREARLYILYHTLIAPTLFTWILLPYYVLSSGYSVLETGALFTAARLVGIPVTLVLGRAFSFTDIRKGLILVHVLDTAALIPYALATGDLFPAMILAGGLIEEAAGTLYFLYPAYERLVYPEERMREALAWHLRLPEMGIILSYPLMGYVLGYLCTSLSCIRSFFLYMAVYSLLLTPMIMLFRKAVPVEEEDLGDSRDAWRRFKLYVAAEALFIAAWSLAPGLALVYLVIEKYGGNIFHVALAESAISLATLTGTAISDRIPSNRAFEMLQLGTLITIGGLGLLVTGSTLPILLAAAYTVRLGDSIVFVYKRTWLYGVMGRREASYISSCLSAFRRALTLLSPFFAGFLAYMDPRAPYISCLALLAATIPLYLYASRREARRLSYTR